MTKPRTTDIPTASIQRDMVLWVRFNGRKQPCRVVSTAVNPRYFRRMSLELKAPNGTVFPRTFQESDKVQMIIQE